eukprot:m.440016 g.440016  ORF g.440016 m.440016 type:complete len:178 (-) comp18454_c0_seq1:1687-2220(-)
MAPRAAWVLAIMAGVGSVSAGSGNGHGSSTPPCPMAQYVARWTPLVCAPITPNCSVGMFQQSPPHPGYTNRVCEPITPCESDEIVLVRANATRNFKCKPKTNPPLDTTQVTVLVISGVILGLLAIVAAMGSLRNKKRKSGENEDDDALIEMGDRGDDHLLDAALSGTVHGGKSSVYE